MKKIILTMLIILQILFFSFNQISALNVSDFTPSIDKKIANMKTIEEKVKFLQSFSDMLAGPEFTKDKDAKLFEDLREYSLNMLNVFQYQLEQEKSKSKSTKATSTKSGTTKTKSTKTTSTNKVTTSTNKDETYINKSTTLNKSSVKLPHLLDNFPNINEQKVRDAILSWHNDERESLGLNDYNYNIDLEGSATTWANKLANSSKTKNLHVRNNGDGTYNYNSILNWFSNLGIKFPASVKGAASFSESVGYGYYKCSKSDCTQDLINAAKKTRTGLIMKEKSYNGDHYRAVTIKHFTQMGAGIAIDKSNNRYYIVLHYGVNF